MEGGGPCSRARLHSQPGRSCRGCLPRAPLSSRPPLSARRAIRSTPPLFFYPSPLLKTSFLMLGEITYDDGGGAY